MKRLVFIVALTFTCFVPAYSQQSCALQVSESPTLRGFKLGMDVEGIRSAFPRLSIPRGNDLGKASINITQGSAFGVDTKGVSVISIGLLDEAITLIRIRYDDSVKWDNVDDFVSTLAESLNLPARWANPQESPYRRQLTCDRFTIQATYFLGNPSIELSIVDAEDVVEKRQEEKEKKRRKEFKP